MDFQRHGVCVRERAIQSMAWVDSGTMLLYTCEGGS